MNRSFAPLIKTADSIEIDSTHMTLQEVADVILNNVEIKNPQEKYEEKSLAQIKDVNAAVSKQIKQRTKQNKPNIFYRVLANFGNGRSLDDKNLFCRQISQELKSYRHMQSLFCARPVCYYVKSAWQKRKGLDEI